MGSNTAEHRIAALGSIQIVHMNGARLGEIEHFLPGELSFGRHPQCDIVFPRDALTVSRLHARLECDQRQCRLIGLGGNGTYVNGKLIDIAVLSSGDVVTFSEQGPKLSFLFQAGKRNRETAQQIATNATQLHSPLDDIPNIPDINDITPLPACLSELDSQLSESALNQTPDPEFTVHFGNELRSFQKPRMTLGRGANADFRIEHPRLLERHAILYFSGMSVVIANATRLKMIYLNGNLLRQPQHLRENDIIMLNTSGPCLIYKGEGKLQEYRMYVEEAQLLSTMRESGDARAHRASSWWQRLLGKLTHTR